MWVAAAVYVQGGVQRWIVLVHDRLKRLDGPGRPVVVGVLQPRIVGAARVPVPVGEVQVPRRVYLHAVPGLSGPVIGIVDHSRCRPTGSVEDGVHQLPTAHLLVGQVQVLGRGVPGDAEESGLISSHRGRGGDVPQGPRVHELLSRLVVAKEVQVP